MIYCLIVILYSYESLKNGWDEAVRTGLIKCTKDYCEINEFLLKGSYYLKEKVFEYIISKQLDHVFAFEIYSAEYYYEKIEIDKQIEFIEKKLIRHIQNYENDNFAGETIRVNTKKLFNNTLLGTNFKTIKDGWKQLLNDDVIKYENDTILIKGQYLKNKYEKNRILDYETRTLKESRNNWSLVISEEDLIRIDRIAIDEMKKRHSDNRIFCQYEALLKGGTELIRTDLKELIKIIRDNENYIEFINMNFSDSSSFSGYKNDIIEIKLGNIDSWKSSQIKIASDDKDWSIFAYQIIFDRIKRLKKWYFSQNVGSPSFLSAVQAGLAVFLSIPFLLTIFGFVFGHKYPIKEFIDKYGFYYVICVMLIFMPLSKWYNYLFPKYIFAIGDGETIYRKIRTIRNIIGYGIMLTLVVSIFANYLSSCTFR